MKTQTKSLLKASNFTKSMDIIYDINKKYYKDKKEKLSLNEIIFLNLILSYEVSNKKCYLTYDQLAEKICKTPKAAKENMKLLKDKEFVDWETGYTGKANTYFSTDKLHNILLEISLEEEVIPQSVNHIREHGFGESISL